MIVVPTPRNLREFYNYELAAARAFHAVERRGVLTDGEKLEELRGFLLVSLEEVAEQISNTCRKFTAFSKRHAERMGWERKDYINLSYPQDVATLLESRGLTLPISRMTHRKTTAEDALNQLYADTGDETCLLVLRAREYTKMLGTYVNVLLFLGILYSSYNVAGTVSGRRSARKNLFGYGTNHQNLPKHSELGKRFRDCIIARPGKILLNCDQCQAEDWIVNGLICDWGGTSSGLEELKAGVDRHRKLASRLFGKPEALCGKDTPERFMGKKTRHAGNYDMQEKEFARQLVKEGHTGIPNGLCAFLLDRFHQEEPGIRGVFHENIQKTLSDTRLLRTPLGRERYFLGPRPYFGTSYDSNRKAFKEAYAYIPQSTVGDNTGLGVLFMESNAPGLVVMESHDAITVEVDDTIHDISLGVDVLAMSFQREIVFNNGLVVTIPVEFELGYRLGKMKGFEPNMKAIENVHDQIGESMPNVTVAQGLDR